MTLTIAEPVRHTVQQILSWFAQGFEHSTESDMLAGLSDAEVEALAEDCGLSTHQLLALVKAGPHAADEMPAAMMGTEYRSGGSRVQDAPRLP